MIRINLLPVKQLQAEVTRRREIIIGSVGMGCALLLLLGSYLYQSTDIGTAMVDFIYKHKGFAIEGEYMKRTSPDPITTNTDGAEKYVYVGDGKNIQGSYLFKNNFEIVSRYSIVNPGTEIKTKEKIKEQYTLGLNKYIKGHRIKLQSDVTYEQDRLDEVNATVKDFWIYRFQIEVGI